MTNIFERLASKLDQSGDCWIFTGVTNPYGQIWTGERVMRAHRVAWIGANGMIPEGLDVLHHCDNPPCCNPDHLYIGTDQDNANDRVSRDRGASGDRHWHYTLTDEQVEKIRMRYIPVFEKPVGRGRARSNANELAAEFGVSAKYIRNIATGWYRSAA